MNDFISFSSVFRENLQLGDLFFLASSSKIQTPLKNMSQHFSRSKGMRPMPNFRAFVWETLEVFLQIVSKTWAASFKFTQRYFLGGNVSKSFAFIFIGSERLKHIRTRAQSLKQNYPPLTRGMSD